MVIFVFGISIGHSVVDNQREDELTYIYPNPFIQSEHNDINFQFFMEQAGDVKISIYNINGQKIKQSLKIQFKKDYITLSLMNYQNHLTHNSIVVIRI